MSDLPPIQPPSGYSNYPRANQPMSGGGYTRPPGIYFDTIGDAWKMIQSDMGTWVLMSLVFMAVTYAVNIPFSFAGNFFAYGSALGGRTNRDIELMPLLQAMSISMIGTLITYPLQTGFQWAALKAVRGYPVGVGDLFSVYPRVGHILLGYFILGVLSMAGFVLCLVPGFYVIGALGFAQLLIVDRGMTATQAVEASYKALKKDGWAMFGLIFVAGLVSGLGACACGVGLIFTMPILHIVTAMTYNYYFPPQQAAYGYSIGIEPPR